MGDDAIGTPLFRRIPGAARPGPGPIAAPVLPEAVLHRMQAAVDAEHDRQGEPNTEPLPAVTGSVPPSQRADSQAASPSGMLPETEVQPDRAARPERALPRRAAKPQRPAEPLRVAKALRIAEEVRAADELRTAEAVRSAAADPEAPSAVEHAPMPAATSQPSEDPGYEAQAPRAAEPPPVARPPVAAAYESQSTPGTIGWLWPEETAIRGGGGRWRPPRRWRYRTPMLIGIGAVLIAAAGLVVGTTLHSNPVAAAGQRKHKPAAKASAKPGAKPAAAASSAPTADPMMVADRKAAATWVYKSVTPGTSVACDPQMCAALTSKGFPASEEVQLAQNSQSLSGANLIVVTPPVRTLVLGANPSLGDLVVPAVLASFGQISIHVVDPSGGAAYMAALSQDVQDRIQFGKQLLNSGRVSASPGAEAELIEGAVDSRLLLAIQAVSNQEPVYIVGFVDSNPGASGGVPLFRAAGLAEADPSGGTSPAYLETMLSVLQAHATFPAPSLEAPVNLAGGQTVEEIEYLAPSPLGLLTSP
jgi:hypothetical protein